MSFPADRGQLAQWGRNTAQANGVDLSKFQQVLTVMNFSCDSGAVGIPGDLVGHGDPQYTDLGFVCHEMGHGFGLHHSWAANPDQEYGDGFNLSTFITTTFNFPALTEGVIGWATVGLNAHNLGKLGALGPVASPTANSDYSDPLVLNALTQSPRNLAGAFTAFHLPRADGTSFTVEARRKAQWDRAIPADNVGDLQPGPDERPVLPRPAPGRVLHDRVDVEYPRSRGGRLRRAAGRRPDPDMGLGPAGRGAARGTLRPAGLPDAGRAEAVVVNPATLQQIQEPPDAQCARLPRRPGQRPQPGPTSPCSTCRSPRTHPRSTSLFR